MSESWGADALSPEVHQIVEAVKACALRLHRQVGPGYREHIYRTFLAQALRAHGYDAQEEVWLDVTFDGVTLPNAVRADIIVEKRVLIELKVAEAWHPVFGAQVLSYLKSSGCPVGLLFNFNVPLLMKTGYRSYLHPALFAPAPDS